MKKINCNDWAPRNEPVPYEWSAPIPITNPLIANGDSLYYTNFHTYSAGGVACVYRNLSEPTITYHYFYEED
jgi:hypothetical protein